ncbi:MAG: aldo/keto reductase [archaeon]|nr:aldo/keto reductase [archaeon]
MEELTHNYIQRFPEFKEFYRSIGSLNLSSVGFGTYLGEMNEKDDKQFIESIVFSAMNGCNLFDSAINYRAQRSERNIGEALMQLRREGFQREEFVLCSKAGYIPFDSSEPDAPNQFVQETFIDSGIVAKEDISEWNILTKKFIDNQFNQSLKNLNTHYLDIFYIHNPEAQLLSFEKKYFLEKVQEVFELLEEKVKEQKLKYYGIASWDGFRVNESDTNFHSLIDFIKIAEKVGGKDHHFKVIQLPFNLSMLEAMYMKNHEIKGEHLTILEAAKHFGINVISSVGIMQGHLASSFPSDIKAKFGSLTNAQASLQFNRSNPSISSSLVGMKSLEHAKENLELRHTAPLNETEFEEIKQMIG